MYKKRIVILFFVFFSYAFLEHPSAQVQKQDIVPGNGINETQEGPVVLKQVSNVEINDNLLSVELVDAEFGNVLNNIALKSGFKVEIGGDVYNKKLNTRFNNIELERGIIRLLTLIKEKNYLIHYDSNGALSGIYVYGGGAAPVVNANPKTPFRPQVQRPARTPSALTPVVPAVRTTPAVQKNPPQGLRRILSPLKEKQQETRTATPPQAPPQPQQDVRQKEPFEEEDTVEEPVDEPPYVPAPRNPPYIPPRAH